MMLHLVPWRILFLNVGRPYNDFVMPLLYCPVASPESIHTGTRESTSERYQSDLLQGVPNQGHRMLTGGVCVTGLAGGSNCRI